MTIDFSWLKDKISRKQIVTVVAIVVIAGIALVDLPEDKPELLTAALSLARLKIYAIAGVCLAALASYTFLSWKHGPEPETPDTVEK